MLYASIPGSIVRVDRYSSRFTTWYAFKFCNKILAISMKLIQCPYMYLFFHKQWICIHRRKLVAVFNQRFLQTSRLWLFSVERDSFQCSVVCAWELLAIAWCITVPICNVFLSKPGQLTPPLSGQLRLIDQMYQNPENIYKSHKFS